MKRFALLAAAFVLSISLPAADPPLNSLSAAEKKEGWKLLFDGRTLKGWIGYRDPSLPIKSWVIEGGCLKHLKSTVRPAIGGGDVLTAGQYTDFDLRFEWRLPPGGNSGVKYLVHERLNAPGAKMFPEDDGRTAVGHEYQMLDDDRHPDARNGPIRQTGALYSLVPPNAGKRVKPIGEFNESRIVVQGRRVEHWLNGARIVEYELESPALLDAIARSKFKPVPGFGTKFKTRILLQDHEDEVWFRNLKIRRLSPGS